MNEPPRIPAAPPRGGRLVLVIGNLTIDDVVLPDGRTNMATLGGNSVHAATAVLAAGARTAVVARRGEDFPPTALAALADAGADLDGLVGISGPTVRNWVIYEEDGSRHWLYRTPPERSAQVAPLPEDITESLLRQAAVVHIAAMPLGHAERIVARIRQLAPDVVITLDTHESWDRTVTSRVLELARAVTVFLPSQEELTELTGVAGPADALALLAEAGIGRAVLKAGSAGAYLLSDGHVIHVGAMHVHVADATGAGDAFCGGLAAGLASGLSLREAVGLGVAVAGTAVAGSGSLRLLGPGVDRPAIAAAGRRLAAASTKVELGAVTTKQRPEPKPAEPAHRPAEREAAHGADLAADPRYDIDVMRQEILTIPDVVSDVLDDGDGRIGAIAKRLAERGIAHLWLTGCGDSAFAGLAAALAFQRHTPIAAKPVHALDLARYQVRTMPTGSAVIATSYSGKVGRTIEAAIQASRAGHHVVALTSSQETDLAQACADTLTIDVPTLGFSPGTSTYVAMLCSLLRLASDLAQPAGTGGDLAASLGRLPGQVEATLQATADITPHAAAALRSTQWTAFLGAGPNEATARFGAAKLIEGASRLGVATNLEEWAHEEYFVTSAGDPVVLVNPSGAGHDRGAEILSELSFIGARPVLISDKPPTAKSAKQRTLLLPIAVGVPEELSPVTACLPLALMGFHLARLAGMQSYNFPSAEARDEHYETIHRVTVGDPA